MEHINARKEIQNSPIAIDETICRGCEMCLLVCSLSHTGHCSPYSARLRVGRAQDRYAFQINVCLHCDDAACEAACPTAAIIHDSQGRVILLTSECINCGACQVECQFNAIYFDADLGTFFKCDLCEGRKDGPRCVESCPTGALSLRSQSLGG